MRLVFHQEPIQAEPEDDDDSSGEQPLYIKEEDDEEEPIKEEEASMDSTDGNNTRLSDLHNTTIKTEDESEEDKPLVRFRFSFVQEVNKRNKMFKSCLKIGLF